MRFNFTQSIFNVLSGNGTTPGAMGIEYVYGLNACFKPDLVAATPKQPYGWDTAAAIYAVYRVTAVTIDLTFTDPSADGMVVMTSLVPGLASTAASDMVGKSLEQVQEWPQTVMTCVNNTGSQKAGFKRRFTISEIEGILPSEYEGNISQYSALVSANPTIVPQIHIALCNLNAVNGSCFISARLTYHTEMWQRFTFARS